MERLYTTSFLLLITVVVLSGCRSYGGYGAEEETYRQIERINLRFEEDLMRARADLAALEEASSGHPILEELAVHYARLVAGHEAVVNEHKDLAAKLSPGSSYRSLRRTYGAIVSEQRTIRTQYQGLLRNVSEAYSADTTEADRDRPYAFIPPYYARVTEAQRVVTVNELLRKVRSGAPDRTEGSDEAPGQRPRREAPVVDGDDQASESNDAQEIDSDGDQAAESDGAEHGVDR